MIRLPLLNKHVSKNTRQWSHAIAKKQLQPRWGLPRVALLLSWIFGIAIRALSGSRSLLNPQWARPNTTVNLPFHLRNRHRCLKKLKHKTTLRSVALSTKSTFQTASWASARVSESLWVRVVLRMAILVSINPRIAASSSSCFQSAIQTTTIPVVFGKRRVR